MVQTAPVQTPIDVGDKVVLKSGGPLMTVREISDDKVLCIYFDDAKQPQHFAAIPEVLQKVRA